MRGWLVVYLLLFCFPVLAQLNIVYPTAHLVIQRGTDNRATLFIAGTFSLPIDRIEARLVTVLPNFGQSIDWQILTSAPLNGVFQGALRATGGLYQLEVRGLRQSQLIVQGTVDRVGIGEVFLVAGQSNAMGLPDLGAKGTSERVVSMNVSNQTLNSNGVTVAPDVPFPAPVMSQLLATNFIFPMGQTAWCWGDLGEAIADKYRVPVAFFNVGFAGTVADNWSRSAHGQTATNIFTSKPWPYLQPYANLRNTLQYYHSQLGIRAVLWHHGESDAVPYKTPLAEYQQLVQDVINQSRLDLGQTMPWVVARGSITPSGPISSPDILGAQNALIQTPGNNVWAGPNTDTIQIPRQPHGHFENIPGGEQGLTEFGLSWHHSMTDSFYAQAQPVQPQRFLRIGLLPSQIPTGKEFRVPFDQIGFSNAPEVRVQLLDRIGTFVTELSAYPKQTGLWAVLPDTLQTGSYQVRVVTNYPVLPSAPSALFRVVRNPLLLNPLLDVETETVGDSVRISWQSAQESLGSRFIVERRDGDGPFTDVGSVNALNDELPYHLYTYTYKPLSTQTGTHQIRLETADGRVLYNPGAIVTSTEERPATLLIYPNPITGTSLTMQLPESGQWTLRVFDATGRCVSQQGVTAVADVPFTLSLQSVLPDGYYLLQLNLRGRFYAQRLLIRH